MKWLDKLNRREKVLSLGIGALIFIWIVFNLIVEPLHNSWARLAKDIEIAKIELKKAVKILQQREYVAREHSKYSDRFAVKESDEAEMALVLNEIETQARAAFVRIVNMKPRRVEKNNFYRRFYVDLDTEASMQNIIKFIKRLKDSKFSMSVEQLTLTSRAGEPSVLSGSITVSRFGINPEK